MLEKVKKWFQRKENLVPSLFVLAIIVAISIYSILFGISLSRALAIFDAVPILILLFLAVAFTGFTVMKSLFFVAAEISLLIFLAESYCAIPNRSAMGDNALKTLVLFGFLYISFYFFKSLYELSIKNLKIVEGAKWPLSKVTTITLFLLFIFLFLWNIYQVIEPITLNLCVFK